LKKHWKQVRSWLASLLTLLLLVTGLIPAMPAFAATGPNWTGITTPAKYVTSGSGYGTFSSPIVVRSRVLSGVQLTYKDATKNGTGIDVTIDGAVVNNTQTFTNTTVTLPDLTLNSSGAVTKVTVKPRVSTDPIPSNDIAEIYYKYVPNPTGNLNFTNTGGVAASDPIRVSNRTVSNLAYNYTDPSSLDATRAVEVRVNGITVRTLTGYSVTIPDIDLSPGLNAIQIYAVNTGESDVIYYEYTSDNSPITISEFTGGTTAYNPVLYGDSKITITGTFGAGVTGNNLRLKLITNNGQTVQDLSNTAPVINNNTFTFTDISLTPGLNQISFYERVGNVTKEHYQFYVQYNNTPLVSDLKINDTPLNDPNLTPNPTFITVPSETRLTLNMGGTAKNADTVEVKNLRTGDVVKTDVSRTGTFGLNLPSQLGENTLEVRVFNQNKEVGVFVRKILVVTTSAGSADQFYKAKLGTVDLVPNQVANVKGPAPSSATTVTGTALLRYVDITNQQAFDRFRVTITNGTTLVNQQDLTLGSGATVVGSPQSGFTQYSISANVPNALFTDGNTYKVSVSYQYFSKGSTGLVDSPSGYITVNNYEYQFKYIDNTKPVIESTVNSSTNQTLSDTGVNLVVTSPLLLKVNTLNISDFTQIAIQYNGVPLVNTTDYEISNTGTGGFNLTLKKLPTGLGKLKILYTGTPSTSVEYSLDVRITPYIQLTYVDSTGQVRSFQDGYQIKSDSDIQNLDGRVYNYVLKPKDTTTTPTTPENISVTLNDVPIDVNSSINTAKGTFMVPKTALNYKKGTNVLKIQLTDDPKTTFIFNVSYNTTKTPSVEDVVLEINQNGKTQELTKKASESSYKTGAHFLSKFTFTVRDATHVYIEKNGKRITDYRYQSGDWDQDESNQDYVNARLDAALNNDLGDIYDDRNLKAVSRTKFEGKFSSTQYGDLVEEIQDAVTDAETQEQKLALFPLTLKKGGTTVYTIVAEDENGTVIRYDINIEQQYSSWEVLSPVKSKETDEYIIVNSNSVPIKIFAENASKILFGKTEAVVKNTTNRDFYYDSNLGKTVPQTYYVFTATVPLKKGLNTIKFTVQVGTESYNDEIKIYNANSFVNGAEYRDVIGKKTSFSVFDKALDLKFPTGTVLLSPSDNRAGQEVKNPSRDIFVDVPIYFGIADRTTGQVTIEGDDLESRLTLETNFNYASPLYYIDAGDTFAPGGRDPYFEEGDAKDFETRYEDNLVPSRAGTLSIKYDPSIVNAANNILTIFYHNGDEWINLGGVVNTGSKTVTVPFEGFGYYMVMKTRESFDDVVRHDFARDAMETLYAKGIMPNYSGSSFGANRDITRGEFATMIVKALDLPINAGPYRDNNQRDPLEPTFSDVRPSRDTWDYQYKYIETAARAGIIRGKQPGYFRPDEPLTREEAAIMIARAMNMKMGTPEASKIALAKMFTDAKDINFYATASVLSVTKAKLMNGEPNDPSAKKPTYRFIPQNNLTRAEMAVITIRVMQQLKKLPKQ